MSADNEADRGPVLFSAVLTPHRSLGATGFLVVMTLVAGSSFVSGVVFVAAGAWPVAGFLGLDVLLVYWAFRANYRAAGSYEEVHVTASELTVRKVSHRGARAEWTLNPLWVKLGRESDEDFGIQRLLLLSEGRELAIASCLAPAEKASFAAALSAALDEARRGPTRTQIN